jgi:acyl-CoA synthetase (AMP-forming)/AMP-acid ligase II
MTILARQTTLATILERNARLHANSVALVCRSTSVSYSALNSKADQLAKALRRRGVAKGTRVGALMRNCHRFIELLFALSKLGAVPVPLNWRLTASELLYVLRDSDSTIIVHGSDFDEIIRTLRVELGADVTVVDSASLEREAGEASVSSADFPTEVWDDDVAVQMYTAAFGGRPRGAQITHGGYVAEAVSVSLALSLTEAGCTLVTVPLFHTFGLELAIATMVRGGKCVLSDPFDAREVLCIIEREDVSVLVCAGQHLADLVKETGRNRGDISSLKVVMGSGASNEMRETIRAWAPKARFVDAVYGQTECGAMVTGCDTEEAEAIGARCVGRPLMCQDVRIFGEDDAEVPAGQVGEIVVRGPRVMAGYYKLPDVNQDSFHGGWLHTGDLGMLDEQGYLHYMGRKRELIKSGMENVYPVEVEMVLAAHPAVREVAVIGAPDEQWVEAVTAIVALKEGKTATAEELMQFCKERIASYKKPKYVHFVDRLPRDGTGQIARQETRARYGKIPGH